MRSYRALIVRSDRGHVRTPAPTFTSGLVRDGDERVTLSDDEVIAEALRILAQRMMRGSALTNPQATREYLAVRFADLQHEVFCCVFLDNRHRVIACEELFRGTVDGASVHPREVVKEALIRNASAVILAQSSVRRGRTEPGG